MSGEAGIARTAGIPRTGSVLLTWHGTLLFNDPRHDWIMHRRPGSLPDEALILIEDRDGSSHDGQMVRVRTRPRALPSFRLEPKGRQRFNLCCVEHGPGEAQGGKYLSAIPDGTLEANRDQVSDWEQFMTLSWDQYGRLSQLLEHGGVRIGDLPPLRVVLADGMVLSTGAHTIDLAEALSAMSGPGPDVGVATAGGEMVTFVAG